MTKEFEDFMRRNTGLLVFLRWDTVAYLKYLESHYDERKYECAYRLLEAIDNLFDFYQITFSKKTEREIPDQLFEKDKINKGFLSHIGKACKKQSDFYGQRWKSTRGIRDAYGHYSAGNFLFADIYGCLHRISDDCYRILKFNEYEIEEKA